MLVSSVPLSLTIIAGEPRRAIAASSSRPHPALDNKVSAINAMHSRVKSSTTTASDLHAFMQIQGNRFFVIVF